MNRIDNRLIHKSSYFQSENSFAAKTDPGPELPIIERRDD